jgi:fatty acid desaturase
MDDFIGVRNVISSGRLERLSQRSDKLGLVQFVSHVGTLAICTWALLLTVGTWWAVPFFFVQGVLINFLFACQHETNHNTAFASRSLNTWVSRFCGFVLLYPCDYEKRLHFAHHRHTQVDDKDPELLARPPFVRLRDYLAFMSGLPFFYSRLRSLVLHARGKVNGWYLTDREKQLIATATRWHCVGYAAIAGIALWQQSWWPLTCWLGPYVCMKWVYWLQGLQEHLGLTHRDNTLLNTRTSDTNPIMRWLNWNMTYHTVHHTFPAVPFHALPSLQREVASLYPRALPESTYWNFHCSLFRSLLGGATETEMVDAADRAIDGS